MAQSNLRQFYTVRKRPYAEHGSLKRRKLTEESRLDIPSLSTDADPLSLPISEPVQVSTADAASKSKTSVTGTRQSTRNKTKRKGETRQTTGTRGGRGRRKVSNLPATPSIILPSPVEKSSSPKNGTQSSEPPSTEPALTPSSADVASTHSQLSSETSIRSATAGVSGVTGSSSPAKEDEDPLLMPSSPKTPKRDSSSHDHPPSSPHQPPSSPHHPPSSPHQPHSSPHQPSSSPHQPSSSLMRPPSSPRDSASSVRTPSSARPRMNLAERMRLASGDPQTPSLNSTPSTHRPSTSSTHHKEAISGKTSTRSSFIPSAKDLAQPAESERQTHRKKKAVATSSSSSSLSSDSADSIRKLYRLSAKELARQTEPERRMSARVAASRGRGKSPATPTPRTPQLQQFKSFVVESPTKSPSKQPAYERYHSLARSATEAPDLTLPYKYQVLLEKFRCTDTVVTMLQKRREICTFNKLKQSVEEMTRRKYENRNLAQMKTVYPTALTFRQEKNIPGIYDHKMYESYQLTVECNVREDGRGEGMGGKEEERERCNAVLDSSSLLRRRKVFNKNLGEITRQHHKKFLSSLTPPLDIPDEKVLRWHPAFQLDMVPDVEEAELPKPPLKESYTTAQDVLNAAQDRLAPRVQRALEGVASTSEAVQVGKVREENGGESSAQMNPALRGVSQKLLEKIQQKEASRVRSAIIRDPAKEKRLGMLARLPHLCRILRSFFVTEKKAAISWDSVVQKLSESHTSSLSPDHVEEHLEFMRESLGGWLSVVEVRKKKFIKIIKNTDNHVLTARMEATRKKLLA